MVDFLLLLALVAQNQSDQSHLAVANRSVVQDQGSWQIDYRLVNTGADVLSVTINDVRVTVEGWVSNSRCSQGINTPCPHALPRFSSLIASGPAGLSALGDVILSADEAQRCRERLIVQVWDREARPPEPLKSDKPVNGVIMQPSGDTVLATVAPGGAVSVRLRLEHQHFLYGDYDPLLGRRTVEIHLGQAAIRDVVPMDREQYLALPKASWPAPPEERRDTRHYISAPDSLHLEAHVPGNQYYRFPERPVRYGTRMRLRFWYLIATGTEGECKARIAQYKDTPTAWKVLSEGAHEECLTKVGRWVKVERVFRTEPDATTIALDFRICDPNNTNIGEIWIDDVELEPVEKSEARP